MGNKLAIMGRQQLIFIGDYEDLPAVAQDGDMAFCADVAQGQVYVWDVEAGKWKSAAQTTKYGLAAENPLGYRQGRQFYYATDTGYLMQFITGAAKNVAGMILATGSYTGNGANGRQIATGFLPLWVFLQSEYLGSPAYTQAHMSLLLGSGSMNLGTRGILSTNGQVRNADAPYIHASDGFVVDSSLIEGNYNATEYKYIAARLLA